MQRSEREPEDAEARITLALNVQTMRQASGLSIRELSARSGVAPATICRIENATHGTTLRRITGLAAAFGVPVGLLLTPPDAWLAVPAEREGGQDGR